MRNFLIGRLFNEASAETGEGGSSGGTTVVDVGETKVTFVGGRALEQHDTPDTGLPEDDRERAKRAVREAMEKAKSEDPDAVKTKEKAKEAKVKKDVADAVEAVKERRSESEASAERGPDGKFVSRSEALPKAPKESAADRPSAEKTAEAPKVDTEADLDIDKASLKQILKQREKVAQAKKEYATEYQRQQQEIQRQAQEFQRQQQDFARQQAELHQQRAELEKLRKNPGEAIRSLGYDPEQFILDLAQEGTPEGQFRKQQAEVAQQLAEIRQWKQQQQEAAQRYQEQQIMRQYQVQRENIVQSFLKTGMDEEKYPHVATFYKGQDKALVAWGDLVAEDYRQLTGKEGTLNDILDYMEDELAERSKSWYSKNSAKLAQTKSVQPTRVNTHSPKGKSLSPDNSSERRSLAGKDFSELDGEERLEAAKLAVRMATANARRTDE